VRGPFGRKVDAAAAIRHGRQCRLISLAPSEIADGVGAAMTDYWVSKLFFDLQQDAKLAAEYRADMPGVLARYDIKPDIRKALLEDDVGKIAPLVNAYLLRFYFQIRGMPQDEFIARLHALKAGKGKADG
jgi:hypothetical protein